MLDIARLIQPQPNDTQHGKQNESASDPQQTHGNGTAPTNSTPTPTTRKRKRAIETQPRAPRAYRRPSITRILSFFPPEQRHQLEKDIYTILAAAPFTREPIDAVYSAIRRTAEDLRRTILAHDPTTPDDDPRKLFAIRAAAEAARQNLIQPSPARLDRIIQTVAEGITPPSAARLDLDDLAAQREADKQRRNSTEEKLRQIEKRTAEEMRRADKVFARSVAEQRRRHRTKQREELKRQLKRKPKP
jgi:hypothetical protein